MEKHKRLFFLLLLIILLFLFYPSFFTGYFQDDWFSLLISRARNIGEVKDFFLPVPELIYYRPLGMQIPFFLASSFFKNDNLPFKIFTLLFHIYNAWLVYLLLFFFVRKKLLSIFGSLMYAVSSVHLIPFYWAATFAFVLGPFFYFKSLLHYLNNNRLQSFIYFILGLFTNELLVTLPLILLLRDNLSEKRKSLQRSFFFSFLLILYVSFRLFVAQPSVNQDYQIISKPVEMVKTFRDYSLWIFNWPEEVHNQFVSFVKLNNFFIKDFKLPLLSWLGNLIIFVTILIVGTLLKGQFRDQNHNTTVFAFCIIFITLVPVLWLSNHAYSYYLSIPTFGLILLLIIGLQKIFNRLQLGKEIQFIFSSILFCVWFFSSWQNVQFNKDAHWAPRRAVLATKKLAEIQKTYRAFPRNAIIILPKSDELKHALSDQNALKSVYQDPSIVTFYGTKKEFLGQLHTTIEDKEAIEKRIFTLP